jgi:excinuclease ABC subunit A
MTLSGATGHNLKGVDVEIPLDVLSVVSGVSGSGKSTLVVETLYPALVRELRLEYAYPLNFRSLDGYEGIKTVKLIDQSPIGRSPRSNPVTYLKIFDPIRKAFAQAPEARSRGMGPGYFSFNVPGGRCETCKGEGYQRLEMYFFEDLYITCEECGGTRYGRDTLSVKYKGRNIHEVLDMTVDEAVGVFADTPQVRARLELMRDIGLGYLRLGQPATTLSGGEAQRLKLCAELGTGKLSGALYVLDEPTVGLHPRDVGALLKVIGRIVDAGNTVIIIEHNLDVIASADWIVDIGPEGGEKGGRILYQGLPEGLLRKRSSHTARYLKPMLRK